MKKTICLITAVLTLGLAASGALASSGDWRSMTDRQLRQAYQEIRSEAARRGITLTAAETLNEGSYIVGRDIQAGDYVITCIATEAESVSQSFGSLGSMLDGLGGNSGTSYSDLYSSLGSALNAMDDGVKIEIVGDYGSVLKTIRLKKGESASLTLKGKVALRISEGSCTLEPK